MSKPVCAVVGIGPGNGAAFARRFSSEGYAVALLSRSTKLSEELAGELGDARAYACDVTSEASVTEAFAAAGRDPEQVPGTFRVQIMVEVGVRHVIPDEGGHLRLILLFLRLALLFQGAFGPDLGNEVEVLPHPAQG